ncbi:MAG: hypothetical protein LBS06_07515 [Treponema sp.]|nr:hypothetical protein [Treponema sp.]
MKRFTVLLIILAGAGMSLAAQEGDPAPRKPEHWWEYLHGLSLGVNAGTHEFPLEQWYPGRYIEGYSIRSLYFMPNISYGRTIKNFHFDAKMEVTVDNKAPNPAPGSWALSAETADRKPWVTIYLEEKMDYPISPLFGAPGFPGTLSVFMNLENYIYVMPDFPGGRKGTGTLEIGPAAYDNTFSFGWFRAELGLPFYYLDRYSDDFGMGMNLNLGYRDPIGLGLKGEVDLRIGLLPDPRYLETEFIVTYEWKDFSVELDIVAEGAFESAIIKPEARYRLGSFIFKLGLELSGLGKMEAFAPYLGLNWNY